MKNYISGEKQKRTDIKMLSGNRDHLLLTTRDKNLYWVATFDAKQEKRNMFLKLIDINSMTKALKLACTSNSCAVMVEPFNKIFVWGIINAHTMNILSPSTNIFNPIAIEGRWKDFDCGKDFMAGIQLNGELTIWGAEEYKNLGIALDSQLMENNIRKNRGVKSRYMLLQVPDNFNAEYKQITCGQNFFAVIDKKGKTYWFGKMEEASTDEELILIDLPICKQVIADENKLYALTKNNIIYEVNSDNVFLNTEQMKALNTKNIPMEISFISKNKIKYLDENYNISVFDTNTEKTTVVITNSKQDIRIKMDTKIDEDYIPEEFINSMGIGFHDFSTNIESWDNR